jgi:hypothetical protein
MEGPWLANDRLHKIIYAPGPGVRQLALHFSCLSLHSEINAAFEDAREGVRSAPAAWQ